VNPLGMEMVDKVAQRPVPAENPIHTSVDRQSDSLGGMTSFLILLLHALASPFKSQARLEAEIVFLRHQLNLQRRRLPAKPRLTAADRLLFVWLYRLVPSLLNAAVVIQPDTIVRWHRAGFRAYWRWKSRSRGGRPKVAAEVRCLIRQMSVENSLWGAPRIHGELLKLGIEVAQSTVAKYMAKRRRPGSGQTWRTFLRNHVAGIGAMDFLVVPTINFRLLFVLVILRHERRRLISLSVTDHPTADWIAQQITEAFPWDSAPTHIIRDRDASYGHAAIRHLAAMGIRDHPIAPRSPWQNGLAERLIGSIRRECLDHLVIFGEDHLRQILKAYATYYNNFRPHLSLAKDAPLIRPIQRFGNIVARPILGGLHHKYCRM
jgi:transposase InsO family protein